MAGFITVSMIPEATFALLIVGVCSMLKSNVVAICLSILSQR